MILSTKAKSDNKVVRTGRIQTWMDDKTNRLPVSCTVFVVDDSMEGPNGIEKSWRFVSYALRNGAGVAIHVSNLRASGSDNGNGLIASGPVSFGKIYSTMNEQLRRGGVYKNGAIVLHMDIEHGDIHEFINTPRHELPWLKRCINLTQDGWDQSSDETKDEIIKGISRGDIWLVKKRYDKHGERIYGNVCLEVFLKSRGTCLLEHVNLGACAPEELPVAFAQGMTELVNLHSVTGVDDAGEYLNPRDDRQVGLGMLGLANLLRIEKVSYAEFGRALQGHLKGNPLNNDAGRIVENLQRGIDIAAEIARASNMERAFAIAPTASCSYNSIDREGFTTTPEIAPPISTVVDRDSSAFGVSRHEYGPVETAEAVGWDDYVAVADGIVEMLSRTELFHGYSFNSWSDVVEYDEHFVQGWLKSPQTSLYYSLQVMQNTQAKDDAMAALDGAFDEMFDFNVIDEVKTLSATCTEELCTTCSE